MEIEAKFIVHDKALFESLMNIEDINGFSVQDAVPEQFTDTYLDTVDLSIYASGFSFRCREKKDKVVYTLKSLKSSDSLIHKREETELSLKEKLPVSKWDNCELKSLILEMIGPGELYPLFTVEHARTDLQVTDGQRRVAELSFDDVTIVCNNNQKSYLELEIELTDEGKEEEIYRLATFFRDEIGLEAGSSSKFDNGFELYMENLRKDAFGLGYKNVPENAKASFLPLRKMFEEYNVEQEHARKVTENSLELFDSLKPVHNLSDKLRETMRFAALVHDIGVMVDLKDHHKAGRDILLRSCPEEIVSPMCLFLPWTTFLHKKKMSEEKLTKLTLKKKFSVLPANMQDDIFKMSAILRMADGLDLSRMNSKIVDVDLSKDEIIVKVQGPTAKVDCDRANTKADLWSLIFDRGITFKKDY